MLGQEASSAKMNCCVSLEENSALLALPGYAGQTQKGHVSQLEQRGLHNMMLLASSAGSSTTSTSQAWCLQIAQVRVSSPCKGVCAAHASPHPRLQFPSLVTEAGPQGLLQRGGIPGEPELLLESLGHLRQAPG